MPGQGVLLAAGVEGRVVAARSRLYGLGCILYQMVVAPQPQRYCIHWRRGYQMVGRMINCAIRPKAPRHDRHYIGGRRRLTPRERMEQIAVGSHFRSRAPAARSRRLGRAGHAGFEKGTWRTTSLQGDHARMCGGAIGPLPRLPPRDEPAARTAPAPAPAAPADARARRGRSASPSSAPLLHARAADSTPRLHGRRDAHHGHRHARAAWRALDFPDFMLRLRRLVTSAEAPALPLPRRRLKGR